MIYQSNNDSLNGTFYIGVFGYSYTTFSLLVKVARTRTTLVEKLTGSLSTVLYEGFPLSLRLHNELDFFLGHFTVALDSDQELLVSIENHEGKTRAYLAFDRSPTPLSFDLSLNGEGSLSIAPGDKVYKRSGTYQLLVIPDFSFNDIFRDNYYSLTVSWRKASSVPHLNSQQSQQVSTEAHGYTVLKHFVQDTTEDIRLSLVSKQGH